MKVKDIASIIEKKSPLELAYSWDNSGLLTGSSEKEVKRVYITLDADIYSVKEAINNNCDMIISHHPIMFGGIKKITDDTPEGRVIGLLLKNDIALYASHTPTDVADGGLNDILAEKLGIKQLEIIEKNDKYSGCGLGRIGNIPESVTAAQFCETVKKALNTPFVRLSGDPSAIIKRVAVGSGACSDLIPAAKQMGADIMVTADMKYHIARDGVERGLCIIDAGHYPTERFAISFFAGLLENTDLEIICSSDADIFSVL